MFTISSAFASRVSRDLRKAGITTLPSGTPIATEGVRVTRGTIAHQRTAIVTVEDVVKRTLRVVADTVAAALTEAGYAVEVSDTYAADGIISIHVGEKP